MPRIPQRATPTPQRAATPSNLDGDDDDEVAQEAASSAVTNDDALTLFEKLTGETLEPADTPRSASSPSAAAEALPAPETSELCRIRAVVSLFEIDLFFASPREAARAWVQLTRTTATARQLKARGPDGRMLFVGIPGNSSVIVTTDDPVLMKELADMPGSAFTN